MVYRTPCTDRIRSASPRVVDVSAASANRIHRTGVILWSGEGEGEEGDSSTSIVGGLWDVMEELTYGGSL